MLGGSWNVVLIPWPQKSLTTENPFSSIKFWISYPISPNLTPGLKILKPGIKLGDIGYTIQSFVEEKGFSVVRDFCGHGISTTFHESPNILHYGSKNTGMELRPGMTFTIEPMINSGKYDVKMLNDGWTAVTKDKSLSAQFEHTLGITENGYEIFTESAKEYSKPPYL